MPTLQEQLQTAVEQTAADSNIFHNIVHGNETAEVITENGSVKTISKIISENQQTLINSISSITEMKNITVSAAQTAIEAAEQAEYAAEGHAENINITPIGNITATNAQSALEELESKKINSSQIGNNANQLVKLDNDAKLPAIDGSQLLNIFSVPVGTILDYVGDISPEGYLICDGTSYNTEDYPNLFSLIGYKFGGAENVFNIPDLRRRTTIGAGGIASSTIGNSIGDTGGTEQHALTTDEMPSHNHSMNQGSNGFSGSLILGTSSQMGSLYTNSVGGGQAHNNIQPSMVVNKIVKY